jgi:hypothetical protein
MQNANKHFSIQIIFFYISCASLFVESNLAIMPFYATLPQDDGGNATNFHCVSGFVVHKEEANIPSTLDPVFANDTHAFPNLTADQIRQIMLASQSAEAALLHPQFDLLAKQYHIRLPLVIGTNLYYNKYIGARSAAIPVQRPHDSSMGSMHVCVVPPNSKYYGKTKTNLVEECTCARLLAQTYNERRNELEVRAKKIIMKSSGSSSSSSTQHPHLTSMVRSSIRTTGPSLTAHKVENRVLSAIQDQVSAATTTTTTTATATATAPRVVIPPLNLPPPTPTPLSTPTKR